MNETNKVSLPCLRGKMGDWMYYITLLSFKEVAKRVKLPKEIDSKYKDKESLKLGEWIQRDLNPKRTEEIVEYLKRQDQRFFNSLILGMYEGKPSWSEISVSGTEIHNNEEDLIYFSKTFGILTLSGNESIFAIDGQHRALSIRKAVKEKEQLAQDEICAIFVAHKTDIEGKTRTRRLFSTLNRYAKPVNKKEIIALSEDDNCAILTRNFVENYKHFKGKIIISGNKAVSPKATGHFTSIISLYEIIERLLTNKSIPGFGKVVGKDKVKYTNTRATDLELEKDFKTVKKIFNSLITKIPSLESFFVNGVKVDRDKKKTSLLFRPIGQKVLFDVYRASMAEGKTKQAIIFFKKDDFNLMHKVWNAVFWNTETENIVTDPSRQRFATLLIMEKLEIPIKRTQKDLEVLDNFGVTSDSL